MKLIVGLGNVGERYAKNRHNVGFVIIDSLAMRLGASSFAANSKFFATIAEFDERGEKVILAKPTTMMNDSGKAVAAIVNFYKMHLNDVWVISDDLDLPIGTVRVRSGGGDGGNNGLKSIISSIGDGFVRFRVGIGSNREAGIAAEDYVLANFSAEQEYAKKIGVNRTVDLLSTSLETGISATTTS